VDAPEKPFLRCDFCGAVSHLVEHFQRWPTGLRSRGVICPKCRKDGPPRRVWRGGTLLYAAGVFSLGALVGGLDGALRFGFAGLALPLLLVVAHECTHALAGRLVGASVFEIRLGWRRPRFQLRIRNTRFTVARGLLTGGYCVAAFLRPRPARWRYAVLYGAPMVLHAVAIAVAVPFLYWNAIGSVHFFVLFNVVFLVASARPIDYAAGAYRIPNDGKALLSLREQVDAWWRPGFVLPAIYARSREDALARARDVETMFPDDPAVGRALFTVYWALGYHAYALRFVDAFVAAVPRPDVPEADLLALGALHGDRLKDWLYCVVLLHGGAWDAALAGVGERLAAETLVEARALWLALRAYIRLLRGAGLQDLATAHDEAEEAYRMLPWVSFVAEVYGAALIERGRLRPGLDRLDAADRLEPRRRELSREAWRAIGLARLRHRIRARRHLREARTRGLAVGPPPALLRRAEAAVGGENGPATVREERTLGQGRS